MSRSWVISLFVALGIGCSSPKQPVDDTDGGPVGGMDAGACAADADCPGGFCSSGLCLPQSPAGTPCSGNDQCSSGICGVVGAGHCCAVTCVQDSSHSCSPDDCNEVGVCSYPCGANCTKDTDCRDPRICDHGACVYPDAGGGTVDAGNPGPQCLIGGQFVPEGTANPANSCQSCNPALDQLDWTADFALSATYSLTAGSYLSGPWPYSSTVGGLPDSLLVGEVSSDAGTQQIHLLNGDLTVRASFYVGGYPQAVAVMDLNGDGLNDLVVAGQSPIAGTSDTSNLISLFLNDGQGGFTAGALYATATQLPPYSYSLIDVQTGDFDGTGNPMLSVATEIFQSNPPPSSFSTQLDLYALDGDGGLAAPTTAAQQLAPNQYATQRTGNFNGDLRTDDMIWAPYAAYGTAVTLLLATGNGQFAETISGTPVDAGAYAYSDPGIAVGDFNGDGRSDLAFANPDGTLGVELADSQGTLGPPITSSSISNANAGYASLLAVDFSGDGHLDLVRTPIYGEPPAMTLWLGNGDGTFSAPVEILLDPPPASDWQLANASFPVAIYASGGGPDLVVAYSTSPTATAISIFRNGCQ